MAAKQADSTKANWYPPWAPRFWNGMRTRAYWRLLRENRFQVHPARYPMAALATGCALFNSGMSRIQQWFWDQRIQQAELAGPPVFIIGHWRSGTTLMHELMALDARYSFPCNFEAFVPDHFLVSRPLLYPLIQLLLPSRRPMDNMAMGVSSPQEDDFALCSVGAPTPYRRIAFPNRPNRDHFDLDLDRASPATQQAMREALERFLKCLTLQYQSRLVLKSPPHTGRLRQLAQWFPDAKFVHLSRHPFKLVPSTMRLWRTLDQIQGFQLPKYDDTWLKNYIFECQELMYAAYFEQRSELPPERLVEVRFEDLVKQPEAEMGRVFEQLQLGEFDSFLPKLQQYFEHKQGHRLNKLELQDEMKADIESRWPLYMETYGYQSDGTAGDWNRCIEGASPNRTV